VHALLIKQCFTGEATFKKGVLTVALPKSAEAQKAAKKIDVKAAGLIPLSRKQKIRIEPGAIRIFASACSFQRHKLILIWVKRIAGGLFHMGSAAGATGISFTGVKQRTSRWTLRRSQHTGGRKKKPILASLSRLVNCRPSWPVRNLQQIPSA
jgi:hypothetical protein